MASLWTLRSGSADAVPHGLCAAGFFPSPSLFACVQCLLYLSIKEVVCALAKNQYYHKGQHRKLSYTFAHYLRPLGRTLYHLLAPWHRTPAGKLLQLFEQTQKGAFFPSISLGSWAFVQRRRCHHCTPWNLALDLGHFFWLIWSPVFLCFLQAQVYKVYLLLIQCNKECLWAKMIDFIHSTKLADSAVDDKVCIEQM